MNLIIYLFTILTLTPLANAKRVAPPKVDSILRGGFEYSYDIESLSKGCPAKHKTCGDRVFMIARANPSGIQKWKTELYQVIYDVKLETDVQTIFPKSLQFKDKNSVELVDESLLHYLVNEKTGALIQPSKLKVYSPKTRPL